MAKDVRGSGELPGCLLSLEFGTNNPQHSESSRLILALGGTQRLLHRLLPVEFSKKALGPARERSCLVVITAW